MVKLKLPVIASKELVVIRAQLANGSARLVETRTQYVPPGWPVPVTSRFVPVKLAAVNIHKGAVTELVDKITVPKSSGR